MTSTSWGPSVRSTRRSRSPLSPPQDFLEALRGAVHGETWISPRLLTGVFRELMVETPPPRPEEQRITTLSRRERDVLGYLVAGMTRTDIADELLLSVNTVRSHVQRMLTKLDVHSALEAAALGRRAGINPTPRAKPPRPANDGAARYAPAEYSGPLHRRTAGPRQR